MAFDLFTVPTVNFQLLYCFFVIEHTRRKILHLNVTRHPSADWVVQQLRAAFPEAGSYRYVIFDRDAKFDNSVTTFLAEPSRFSPSAHVGNLGLPTPEPPPDFRPRGSPRSSRAA